MNAKQTRHLVRKWDAHILKHQIKERFDGRRITPADELARDFEKAATLKIKHRRSQALRASGQKSEAQRNDASGLRLQRPRYWEDVREDQGVRATAYYERIKIWIDEYAGISAQVTTAERMAERLQEIRPDSEMRSQHSGQARSRVRRGS